MMYASNGKGSIVRLASGVLVLLGIALSQLVNPYWLILSGFVGLFLIISSLTGFCMGAAFFRALGMPDKEK